MRKSIDNQIDDILTIFREQNAVPIAFKAVDKVLRPYYHWISEAQWEREDPLDVRSVTIHLISSMMMEISNRMGERLVEGGKLTRDVWLGEFMLDLKDELVAELKEIEEREKPN